jgi:hypothetical protein
MTKPKKLRLAKLDAKALTKLERQLTRRSRSKAKAAPRWNPDPDDVQRSVVQLVLSLVEFVRKLMERQAIRRMEARTLSARQIDDVGLALMRLEETIADLAGRFGIDPSELNLDLGPLGKLH